MERVVGTNEKIVVAQSVSNAYIKKRADAAIAYEAAQNVSSKFVVSRGKENRRLQT